MSAADSATKPVGGAAVDNSSHGKYHQCECYGHDVQLPDYKKDISHPRTLQGYYATQGGCPCPPKKCSTSACAGCTKSKSVSKNSASAVQAPYRTPAGEHVVLPATGADEATTRDPAKGTRTVFPNARNYGGTVDQRGATTLASSRLPRSAQATKREAKKVEAQQDRKAFLKAVLRDEMLARMDAEAEREALECDLGLLGANHAVDYEAIHGTGTLSGKSGTKMGMHERGIHDVPTVAEQYAEVLDELEYVAGQPVGSKFNIIRLHYLVEEENRVNALRRQQKMQTLSSSSNRKSVA